MSLNTITVVGNLTGDLELRYLDSGQPVARTSIAVDRQRKINNEWQTSTSFFPIVLWGSNAEHAAASLPVGTRVMASGRLEHRTYEAEGEKRSITELIVTEIGPTMRWQTATVTKATKAGNDDDSADNEPF